MCKSIIYSVLITVDFLIKNAVPIVKAFVSSVLFICQEVRWMNTSIESCRIIIWIHVTLPSNYEAE